MALAIRFALSSIPRMSLLSSAEAAALSIARLYQQGFVCLKCVSVRMEVYLRATAKEVLSK